MRRTLLKIAIFVLTLGLGVGVSVGWHLYQWSLVPYDVNPIPPWPFEHPSGLHVGKAALTRRSCLTARAYPRVMKDSRHL